MNNRLSAQQLAFLAMIADPKRRATLLALMLKANQIAKNDDRDSSD